MSEELSEVGSGDMARTNPMLTPVELPNQRRSTAGEVMAKGEDIDLSEISSVRVMTAGTVHLSADSGEHEPRDERAAPAAGHGLPRLLLVVLAAALVGGLVTLLMR